MLQRALTISCASCALLLAFCTLVVFTPVAKARKVTFINRTDSNLLVSRYNSHWSWSTGLWQAPQRDSTVELAANATITLYVHHTRLLLLRIFEGFSVEDARTTEETWIYRVRWCPWAIEFLPQYGSDLIATVTERHRFPVSDWEIVIENGIESDAEQARDDREPRRRSRKGY